MGEVWNVCLGELISLTVMAIMNIVLAIMNTFVYYGMVQPGAHYGFLVQQTQLCGWDREGKEVRVYIMYII